MVETLVAVVMAAIAWDGASAEAPPRKPDFARAKKETYTIDGKPHEFLWLAEANLLISAFCYADTRELRCAAFDAVTRAMIEDVPHALLSAGGREPGALICEHSVHGQWDIARRRDGGELTVCVFKDGSMVSAGSLTAAARRHGRFDAPRSRK